MLIKDKIKSIEDHLNKLESSIVDFDDQVDIYKNALNEINQLKKSVEAKINTIEPWK